MTTDIHYLDDSQVRSLLAAARPHRRDYLMLVLAYQLGLRAMETCSLQAGQFDCTTDKVFLTIQRSKRSRKTRHELEPATADLVREYVQGMRPSDYLFRGNCRTSAERVRVIKGKETPIPPCIGYTTFYAAIHKYARLAGIPLDIAHPHVLKHSCAMAMLPNGVKVVQEHLGHRSGNSSMIYLSVKRADVDAAAHRSLVGAL